MALTLAPDALSDWSPPDALTGAWRGKAEVFADFKKGDSPSEHPEDWIAVRISIEADGTVQGRVGNARFSDCRIARNRGWLGRKLNIKTDYIIRGGLKGRIVPDDTRQHRTFTIPFNLADGKLTGGFMVTEQFKYPWPLFPRLHLEREPDTPPASEEPAPETGS
jgi:hypothetical protein